SISPFSCLLSLSPLSISTFFPYTTLFRSVCLRRLRTRRVSPVDHWLRRPQWLRSHLPRVSEETDEQSWNLYGEAVVGRGLHADRDRKSTRLNSSHVSISYAVFCLKIKIFI